MVADINTRRRISCGITPIFISFPLLFFFTEENLAILILPVFGILRQKFRSVSPFQSYQIYGLVKTLFIFEAVVASDYMYFH